MALAFVVALVAAIVFWDRLKELPRFLHGRRLAAIADDASAHGLTMTHAVDDGAASDGGVPLYMPLPPGRPRAWGQLTVPAGGDAEAGVEAARLFNRSEFDYWDEVEFVRPSAAFWRALHAGLSDAPPVVALFLREASLDEESWKCIARLSRIRDLGLYRCTGAADLGAMGALTELRALSLSECEVDALDFSGLSRCVELKILLVEPPPRRSHRVPADSLAPVAALPRLHSMSVERSFDDGCVAALAGSSLRVLSVTGPGITDRALEAVAAGFPALEVLKVKGTAVTKDGVARLLAARPTLLIDSNFDGDGAEAPPAERTNAENH